MSVRVEVKAVSSAHRQHSSPIPQWTLTWDPETGLLTFLEAPEVVCVALAASPGKHLAPLGDRVVVVAFNVSAAGPLVHLEETHAWNMEERQKKEPLVCQLGGSSSCQ